MTQTHTHARSRTHTQKNRSRLSPRGKLEARLLYRGCLAFDGCCGTSKTAVERGEKLKIAFWGVAWAWLALASRKAISWLIARLRDLNAQSTRHGARPGPTCTVVHRWVPCVPSRRERENRPTAGRGKSCVPEKKSILHRVKLGTEITEP